MMLLLLFPEAEGPFLPRAPWPLSGQRFLSFRAVSPWTLTPTLGKLRRFYVVDGRKAGHSRDQVLVSSADPTQVRFPSSYVPT
jgi:hypothetical protein